MSQRGCGFLGLTIVPSAHPASALAHADSGFVSTDHNPEALRHPRDLSGLHAALKRRSFTVPHAFMNAPQGARAVVDLLWT